MEAFGKFMTIIIGMIISPIITGFVLTKLWAWILVPTFQIQPLRLIEAIGILVIIGFVRFKKDDNDKSENTWKRFLENLIYVIFYSAIALLYGWIVSWFI